MIGRKLTERLGKDGALAGKPIEKARLVDVRAPPKPENTKAKVETVAADLATPGEAATAIAGRPDTIFHLAGVVSGEAEVDFDKGYRVNLDGTRALLEAIRAIGDGYRPRLVFTSSIAGFGARRAWSAHQPPHARRVLHRRGADCRAAPHRRRPRRRAHSPRRRPVGRAHRRRLAAAHRGAPRARAGLQCREFVRRNRAHP